MKDYTVYRVVIQLIQGATALTLKTARYLQPSEMIDFYKSKSDLIKWLNVKDFNYPLKKYKTLSKSLYKSYISKWSNLLDIPANKVVHIQEINKITHENHYINSENLHITLYVVVKG